MGETRIETAEEMADRYWSEGKPREMVAAIRARDEQIVAKCEEIAGKAGREAEAHGRAAVQAINDGQFVSAGEENILRIHCEGQASALRSLIALLRGGAP